MFLQDVAKLLLQHFLEKNCEEPYPPLLSVPVQHFASLTEVLHNQGKGVAAFASMSVSFFFAYF